MVVGSPAGVRGDGYSRALGLGSGTRCESLFLVLSGINRGSRGGSTPAFLAAAPGHIPASGAQAPDFPESSRHLLSGCDRRRPDGCEVRFADGQ